MTKLSQLIQFASLCSNNIHKGSTYGKASITPGPNSIQFSGRGYQSLRKNRIKVLSGQITIIPLYSQSIIVGNERQDLETARNH